MRILSTEEFQTEAEPVLKRIFVNDDPYDTPFAPDVESRLILFRYEYEMEQPLLDAVINTASKSGDDGFYVSIQGYSKATEPNQPYHWYVAFSEIAAYQSRVEPVTTMIYSPNGLWGILGSHESHGLMGGSKSFIEAVKLRIPDIDQQVFAFIETWKNYAKDYGTNIGWLPQLLTHVYGIQRVTELIQAYSL